MKRTVLSTAICTIIASGFSYEIQERVINDSVPAHNCVDSHLHKKIAQETSHFIAANPSLFSKEPGSDGVSGARSAAISPPLYSFFPQAGLLTKDIYITNFVDLDPTAGIQDYNCGNATYNNHDGIDSALTSFGKQEIGVPIYAVLDGTVTSVHDGEFDQNTVGEGQPANYIYIAHPDGRSTFYTHLKKNSVMVSVGQAVVAGQQIGLTGSSGNSTGPHLHMETIESGIRKEPFAGDCRPGDSLWAAQPVYDTNLAVVEFTATTDDLGLWAGPPYETSRTGYLPMGVQQIFFWVKIRNTLANNVRNTRFLRPDGSVRYDLGTRTFTGPQRTTTRTYNYNINFDASGEWTIEYTINGLVVRAPLTIVSPGSPTPNRNPHPLAVQLVPAAPAPDDVVAAQVSNWNVIDDPDYDILRYRYVWTRDGVIVRDVTSAALSDYIPRTIATAGSGLECTVTATDGEGGSTLPATASAVVSVASTITEWNWY